MKRKDKFLKLPSEVVKKSFHNKDLIQLTPLTDNQKLFIDNYRYFPNKHHFLSGFSGTGKSYLALRLAIEDVLNKNYEKLIIIRSSVATRDIGYVPGTTEEKLCIYETPYHGLFDSFFPFKKSYDNLKLAGKVEFHSSSFLRGQTFEDAIIFVDECQSMNFHELDSIITRASETSKIIFAGDICQNDLIKSRHDVSGFVRFSKIIQAMEDYFEYIEFGHDDIVRGKMMKDYIIKRDTLFD